MLNIAIAGGNGALGRTILRAIREEGDGQFRPYIFTRKKRSDASDDEEIEVPYRNVHDLVKTLEEKRIHTIICTFDMTPRSLGVSQRNLIRAAEKSSCVRRFVPTNWAIAYPRSLVGVLPSLGEYFDCLEELERGRLEWGVVVNGLFLDYYGMQAGMETELARNVVVVDVKSRTAAIPGDGEAPVSFTYSRDVGRFVVKMLGMREGTWEREMRIVGDTSSWNEFVRMAEDVIGQKFDIAYDSIARLKRSQVTELPGHRDLYEKFPKEKLQWFLSIFELMTVDGTSHIDRNGSLNELFPEIQAMTVREMLQRYWASKR